MRRCRNLVFDAMQVINKCSYYSSRKLYASSFLGRTLRKMRKNPFFSQEQEFSSRTFLFLQTPFALQVGIHRILLDYTMSITGGITLHVKVPIAFMTSLVLRPYARPEERGQQTA